MTGPGSGAPRILIAGGGMVGLSLALLLAGALVLAGVGFKLIQGLWADKVYEKQYSRWRIDPKGTESGVRQFNLILGIVLFTGLITVFFNLVADIMYGVLDPRIRLD